MKVFALSIYDKFNCTGALCPCTCCRGWKIMLDEESLVRYHSVSGKIGSEMRDSILYDESGNAFIKLNEDGFCPLLNEEKLCRIYIEAGEDKMCNTCQNYPRGVNIYGDLYMKYICISCPEMARILFSQKEPLEIHIEEDDKIPLPKSVDFNWNYFNELKDGMFTTIQILQNRTLPLNVRIQTALLFNDIYQDCLIKNGNGNEIITMFTRQETMNQILSSLQNFQRRKDYMDKMVMEFNREIAATTDNLWDIITFIETAFHEFKESGRKEPLSLAEFINSEPFCRIFENYCVYYIVQHYLESYNNKNPLDCVVTMLQSSGIFAWLFGLYGPENKKTPEDYTIIVSLISRRTEHSTYHASFLHKILKKLNEKGMGATDYLLSVFA